MSQYQSEPILPANTKEEWRTLLEGDDQRIIRTREEWDRAMAEEERRTVILPNCDDEIVRAFTDSLSFRNGGLAGADYSVIEKTLSYRQFTTLWNNFGIGSKLFTDYMDMECRSPGTCGPRIGYVCTSNC